MQHSSEVSDIPAFYVFSKQCEHFISFAKQCTSGVQRANIPSPPPPGCCLIVHPICLMFNFSLFISFQCYPFVLCSSPSLPLSPQSTGSDQFQEGQGTPFSGTAYLQSSDERFVTFFLLLNCPSLFILICYKSEDRNGKNSQGQLFKICRVPEV